MELSLWNLRNAAQNIEHALKRLERPIAQRVLEFFRDNFDKQGYEDGGSFTPWAARKYNLDRPLLVKTGKLRNSFEIFHAGNGRIVVGNSAEYAEYVQNGTDDTPARPLVYDSERLAQDIQEMINAELLKAFNS